MIQLFLRWMGRPAGRAGRVLFILLFQVNWAGSPGLQAQGASQEKTGEESLAHSGEGPQKGRSLQRPKPASSAAPGYHNLRYEEIWSQRDADLWGPAKYVPLNGSGSVFASFGGQLRVRSEFWSSFGFGAPALHDDTFGLFRLRLHGDLHLGSAVRVFVEGKSALSDGRELPGGPRALDADSADLQNVFVDVKLPLEEDGFLTFRVGRQELQFGRQRLVSPLDWSNTRPRMFDGFRAIARFKSWRVDGFWSRFVRLRKYAFNNHDSGLDFFGIYASGRLPQSPFTLDLYWLGLERMNRSALPGGEERHTLGSRLSGKLNPSNWDFDLEASYQFGESRNLDIEAFMLAAQVGYTLASQRMRPRVYLGFDYASGDGDPLDREAHTFDQLFPLGHAYLGFIDTVARKNVVDFSQGLSFGPLPRMTIAAGGHFFWRAREQDALYNAAGAVVRSGAVGTSKRLGSEIDLTWRYGINRHTLVVLGYSHFFTGQFIQETGSEQDIDFGYLTVQYTF